MNRKSKESFLLFAPVVALLLFGFFKYWQQKTEDARFKPFIQTITCEHLPRTKEGKQTARIELALSHQGTIPAWWGKSVKVNIGDSDIQFHVPGKNTWYVPISHAQVNFDKHHRQYIVTFQRVGNGSQLYSLYRGNMRGKLEITPIGSNEATIFHFNHAFDQVKGQPAP